MKKKTYKLCPACSNFCRSDEADKFCNVCGSELIEACQHCGTEIDMPYARYCKHCGSPYRNTEFESVIRQEKIVIYKSK
ncbi:zinc-ribbon domain-containing protein [bacterium]|nr:MAG: zinc-ribbon domain-containing protein [bacterium]